MSLRAELGVRLGELHLAATLDAVPGEVIAVLGPNGAGKTTLLRALAGLQPLTRGRVQLDGITLEDTAAGVRVPTEHRSVGVVLADPLLFRHLSVLENVAFGLRSRGVRKRDARRRAMGWLERVGLGDRAHDRPHRLSGGQAQRVALARALATGPRLVLLDEPLAAVDAGARLALRRELRRHLASFGGVPLVVTHDPLEAMTLADRLVILEAGRIVQEGTPTDVRERPRSAWVADLVGVNLFAGHGQGGHVRLDGDAQLTVAGPVHGAVLAVVHPRAVALHRELPAGSPRNVWRGPIEAVDHQGERVRVRVGGAVPVVAEVTPAAVRELALAEGGEVWVAVKATEVTTYPQ